MSLPRICMVEKKKKNIYSSTSNIWSSSIFFRPSRFPALNRRGASSILFTFVNVPGRRYPATLRDLWKHSEPGRFILRKTGWNRGRSSRTGNGVNSPGKFINPLCTYCAPSGVKCRRFREIPPSAWSCFLPLVTSPTCLASSSCLRASARHFSREFPTSVRWS